MAESLTGMTRKAALGCVLSLLAAAPFAIGEVLVDPTRPPLAPEAALAGEAGGAGTVQPVLQSVLIAPGRAEAIISGRVVKPGDKFGSGKVVRISESEVVLQSGKESQTLKLFPGIEKRMTSSHVGTRPDYRKQ